MTDSIELKPPKSKEDLEKEYHLSDVERMNFIRSCKVNDIQEKESSRLQFISTMVLIVALELVLIFYLLGEQLGYSDALYAAILTITIIFFCAFGLSFSNANTSVNLKTVRRLLGYLGQFSCLIIFMLGLGLVSNWRADGLTIGIQSVIDGYKSMTELPIFVATLVNFGSFVYLAYEARKYCWSKYWGYRRVIERYQAAKNEWDRVIKSSKESVISEAE